MREVTEQEYKEFIRARKEIVVDGKAVKLIGAGRLVLELKGKVERLGLALAAPEGEAEALAALTGLGYSLAEATSALAALPREPGMALEEKVRLALQRLGRG